jgi:hypothetical protein
MPINGLGKPDRRLMGHHHRPAGQHGVDAAGRHSNGFFSISIFSIVSVADAAKPITPAISTTRR